MTQPIYSCVKPIEGGEFGRGLGVGVYPEGPGYNIEYHRLELDSVCFGRHVDGDGVFGAVVETIDMILADLEAKIAELQHHRDRLRDARWIMAKPYGEPAEDDLGPLFRRLPE